MSKSEEKKPEEKKISRRSYLKYAGGIVAAGAIAAAGYGIYEATKPPPTHPPVELVFTSPEWLPGSLTGDIAKGFTDWSQKNLGYPTTVKMDLNPWGTYHDRLATILSAKGSDFDLLIADSQFIGEFAEGGHILKLNDWIKAHQGKDINMFDFPPNLVKYFCTYPVWNFDEEKFKAGDLQLDTVGYYGIPHEADVMALVYRTDLFTNPDERAAFRAKYGYDLKPPETWAQLRDLAEFFTRPPKLYGIASKFTRAGDCISTDWNQILWCFGGELWNPQTHQVRGYVNSPAALKALEFYKSLYKVAPSGSATYGFDEVNRAVQEGLVAMAVNWYAFMPSYLDPAQSKVYDKLGFAVCPRAEKHYVSLGGQGIGVCTYSKYKKEALQFIDWFQSDATQWKWVDGGGYTGKKSILNTDRFLKAKPYNGALRDSLPLLKDFWNMPEYADMLDIMQENLNAAVVGQKTPKQALDEIAEKQHAVLELSLIHI